MNSFHGIFLQLMKIGYIAKFCYCYCSYIDADRIQNSCGDLPWWKKRAGLYVLLLKSWWGSRLFWNLTYKSTWAILLYLHVFAWDDIILLLWMLNVGFTIYWFLINLLNFVRPLWNKLNNWYQMNKNYSWFTIFIYFYSKLVV